MQYGKIYVLSGPSGVGKGSLCRLLRDAFPDLLPSVSVTSRKKREGEIEGRDYYFVSPEQFQAMIRENALLEWAVYNGNYYGTPRGPVEAFLQQGRHVLLEVEVKGALQVKENFPDACLIFILPPDEEALRNRLLHRGDTVLEDIEARLQIARQEIEARSAFDHILINDQLDRCMQQLIPLVKSPE